MEFSNVGGKYEVKLVEKTNTSMTYKIFNVSTAEVLATGEIFPDMTTSWSFPSSFFEHHGPSENSEVIHLMRMSYRNAQDFYDPIIK